MKLDFWNKEKEYIPTLSLGTPIQTLKQQFKGEVENNNIKFPKELGLEHPFDFKFMENIWKGFGLANSVVDKYVDFIVGPGFFVRAQSERAQKILDQWMKDVNLDTVLRAWFKEALVKGTGFAELGGKPEESIKGLKVLDAESMFIIRDEKGKILGYHQFTGNFNTFNRQQDKVIRFDPFQVAMLALNRIGDDAYGQGIIHPVIPFIDMLTQNEKNMQILLQRKANAPLHAKLGDKEHQPSPEAVNAIGAKLQSLNNVQEWATDFLVDLKVIDFPDFGKKFDFPIEHNIEMLAMSWQVPKVILGLDVNLAVAQAQTDAFERRIQSIQAEAEKVIEQQMLQRVLLSNDIQENVEFEWGEPSQTEKNNRINQINELLKNRFTTIELRKQLELQLSDLMDLDVETIEEDQNKDDTDTELEDTEQPRVPGENNETVQKLNGLHHPHTEQSLEDLNEADLKEWLDFDYEKYLAFILSSVNSDSFSFLAASNAAEAKLGRLLPDQITSLREVLSDGFKTNKTLNQIAEDVKLKVNPGDLKNQSGKLIIGADARNMSIARGESTRFGAIGAEKAFAAEGVEEYQWVTTAGARTCPICEALHGQIFSINSGAQKPPAHAYCRCTIVAVIRG